MMKVYVVKYNDEFNDIMGVFDSEVGAQSYIDECVDIVEANGGNAYRHRYVVSEHTLNVGI